MTGYGTVAETGKVWVLGETQCLRDSPGSRVQTVGMVVSSTSVKGVASLYTVYTNRISDAHEWITEVPTVPNHGPANSQSRERA